MLACLAPKRTTLRQMTDKEKEAHLWLHDRIDELRGEHSSIWQKLSQFSFWEVELVTTKSYAFHEEIVFVQSKDYTGLSENIILRAVH